MDNKNKTLNSTKTSKIAVIKQIIAILSKKYPDVKTDLQHYSAFELLVATILSAQCTDKRVNIVTPELFAAFRNVYEFSKADQEDVEKLIFSTGFYKNKAKNIIECSKKIVAEHNGEVPATMKELVELPGVGRKTANCVLGNYFEPEGIVVDTHVIRITNLLGLVVTKNAEKIEKELMEIVPKKNWVNFTHYLIRLGRETCIARRPKCTQCEINKYCKFYELKES